MVESGLRFQMFLKNLTTLTTCAHANKALLESNASRDWIITIVLMKLAIDWANRLLSIKSCVSFRIYDEDCAFFEYVVRMANESSVPLQ